PRKKPTAPAIERSGRQGPSRVASFARLLPVVGWREWVGLPQLGIDQIKAKIDTGARTSALHAMDIEPFRKRGRQFVRFCVHPHQANDREAVLAMALVQDYREVRSSDGTLSLRPAILTELFLMGQRWPIELTLVNRDQMGFRLLLGRTALSERLLVD